MGHFRSAEVRQLLHNKFVVVLGDSIQRSVYKDLVKLLRTDDFLTEKQLEKRVSPKMLKCSVYNCTQTTEENPAPHGEDRDIAAEDHHPVCPALQS
ncbi:PC-esterase domain-containing protein 1A-like [Engystomops pustulosus]|uniref:PC-esterase domain-containing protein 1A-like n=1 Tax=Engystomops pustulosus TaxID=76066 RepID=UPI003AFA6DFE